MGCEGMEAGMKQMETQTHLIEKEIEDIAF